MVFIAGLSLVTAGWLRWAEAVRTTEVVEILGVYREYRAQRLNDPAAPRLVPGAVIAADELTADWAAILERARPLANYWIMLSPSVDNDEWDLRIALKAYLMGRDRLAFLREQEAALSAPGFQGPWGRDRAEFTHRLESRRSWYDRIAVEPEVYLAQAHLRYVWLPPGQRPPGDESRWTERQDGTFWAIWEYRSAP